MKLERLKDAKKKIDNRQSMNAILVADHFVNNCANLTVTQDARINTLLDETFQLTVR